MKTESIIIVKSKKSKLLLLILFCLIIYTDEVNGYSWYDTYLKDESIKPLLTIDIGQYSERTQLIGLGFDELMLTKGLLRVELIENVATDAAIVHERKYIVPYQIIFDAFLKFTVEEIHLELKKLLGEGGYSIINDWESPRRPGDIGTMDLNSNGIGEFYDSLNKLRYSHVFVWVEPNLAILPEHLIPHELSPFWIKSPFDGTWRNSWFGQLYDYKMPWINHKEHGWIFIGSWRNLNYYPRRGTVIIIYDVNLDEWFYVEESNFPFVYAYDKKKWYYYLKGSRSEGSDGWWFDSGEGNWKSGSELFGLNGN